METIKFRAWDKDKEKMLSWKQIIHNTSNNLFGGLFELFRRPERFKALQFTGITDKNDKNIYEGDLLKYSDVPLEICWGKIGFIARYDRGTAEEVEFDWWNNCEVIGNIFENPELLDNK